MRASERKLKPLSKNQKIFFTLVALFTILFLIDRLGLMNTLTSPIQKIAQPAQIVFYKTNKDFGNFFGTIKEIGSLRSKANDLEAENAILAAENAKLKKLETENELLREQLGTKVAKKKLIMTQVIGKDPLFTTGKLILDKGTNDGVEEGLLVILKDILIGKISSASTFSSSVTLVIDPDTKIPAVTEGGSGGIVEGEFGAGMSLTKVVQTEGLKEGEIVLTSGASGFLKGLVIGKIEKIDKDPAALFQKAKLSPIISFSQLDFVFIIRRK